MSGTKQYPTRMHEVLGVEPGERFYLKKDPDGMPWYVTEGGMMIADVLEPVVRTSVMDVFSAINHGITRRPRLSEEQVKKLHAALLLGFKWLTVNSIDELWLFGTKPRKFNLGWGRSEGEVARLTLGNHLGLSRLVSWSDPEPLDIVATLKAVGVEVEE